MLIKVRGQWDRPIVCDSWQPIIDWLGEPNQYRRSIHISIVRYYPKTPHTLGYVNVIEVFADSVAWLPEEES